MIFCMFVPQEVPNKSIKKKHTQLGCSDIEKSVTKNPIFGKNFGLFQFSGPEEGAMVLRGLVWEGKYVFKADKQFPRPYGNIAQCVTGHFGPIIPNFGQKSLFFPIFGFFQKCCVQKGVSLGYFFTQS